MIYAFWGWLGAAFMLLKAHANDSGGKRHQALLHL
jgi:hypothetical protein